MRESQDLSKLFNRLPPHALEAEMCLLGAVILDPRFLSDVLQHVTSPNDFYQNRHGLIFQALLDLYNRDIAIDLVQLQQRLSDIGALDDVGGVTYLVELAEGVPSASSAQFYAKTVHDKAVIRGLIDSASQIIQRAYTSADQAEDQVESAEKAVFRLAETNNQVEHESIGDSLQAMYTHLEENEGKVMTGMETGFIELDEMTGGLHEGEMVIVAARPSMGKSTFALNMATHMASRGDHPVAFFSMEMSRESLAQRVMCSRARVDSHRMRRNTLSTDEFGRLAKVVGEMSDAKLFIDDSPGLTMLQLRTRCRRLMARHGIKAVFVDYLQLMSCPNAENRQIQVSELSRGMKSLAVELGVPVICLSQLNRASEMTTDKRPKMSNLRESGSLENDADVVMLLHREAYYHIGDQAWLKAYSDQLNVAEVIVAKQRNGPTGSVQLHFDGASTTFSNLSHGY